MASRRHAAGASSGHGHQHQRASHHARSRSRSHRGGGGGRDDDIVKVAPNNNMFANDGSFMDMFKKKVASVGGSDPPDSVSSSTAASTLVSDGHSDWQPTMNLCHHRTLPPGGAYAAAATTYVQAARIPSSIGGVWTTTAATTATAAAAHHTSMGTVPTTAAALLAPGHTGIAPAQPVPTKKSPSLLSFIGRRRGGKTLPTGIVKKAKIAVDDTQLVEPGRTDAWSQYMAEVRKYKEMSCEDEGKTRPLVK